MREEFIHILVGGVRYGVGRELFDLAEDESLRFRAPAAHLVKNVSGLDDDNVAIAVGGIGAPTVSAWYSRPHSR